MNHTNITKCWLTFNIAIAKWLLHVYVSIQSKCHARILALTAATTSFSCHFCNFVIRFSGFMPVDCSNQPRNVKRWRRRTLLSSIFAVSIKYSSFPFLITCPTKRICLVIACINCLVVLARYSTSSFDILSIHEIFIIRRKPHFCCL